jgi:hypothetical protein
MPRSLYDDSNPDPNTQWTIDPTTKQWVNVGSGQRVEYGSDRDRPWNNLLHVLPYLLSVPAAGFGIAALTGGLGAAAAGGAGSAGASGATGGVLPSSSYPVASLMGGPAAIASQGASRGIPWGGAANAAEDYLGSRPRSGVGRALGAAGDEAGRWSPLLQSAIAALAGLPALLSSNHGPSAEERALYDQARQMQALQQKRIESQNPLFSAVTQLAMSRLPGASQQPLGTL